jgi:hypothetical protein
MSTLIGQRERLAVEFKLSEVKPEHQGWIHGTLSLWAGGHRISRHGRHDEECRLAAALTVFDEILREAGNRTDPALMAMPAEQAFATIHRALYEDDGTLSFRESIEHSAKYEKFEVFPSSFEALDGHHGFLIEDGLFERLIWRATADMVVREIRIGAGEFERTIDAFLTALEKATGHPRYRYRG